MAGGPHDELVAHWVDWWNTGDVAIADAIYDPEYRRHAPDTPGHGPEPIKNLVAMFRTAFPDMHYVVEDTITEGDRVVVRWTCTATNKGDFMGMPPTGRSGTLPGCDILRIAGGRIVESWPFYDRLTIFEQIKDPG